MENPLSVTMVSPEASPFASSGGLGDVLGSLPLSLEALGAKVSLIIPAHRSVLQGGFPLKDTGIIFNLSASYPQEEARILETTIGKAISVYFIKADRYFDRNHLYSTPGGDYPDNAERFVFFCRAALEFLKRTHTDIIHCHDWQSALAIAFLKVHPPQYPQLSGVKTVFTVHNLGFQGLFPPEKWNLLNLHSGYFAPQYLEYYGNVNSIKGGLVFADALTTVSPTYAEEIKTVEQGFGLEGIFRERASSLTGILNGISRDIWNPATDRFIASTYGAENLAGKKACKAALQSAFSLPGSPRIPLLGMVSRLTHQKGFDLLEQALDSLLSRDIQLAILGSGDRHYQDFLLREAVRYPKKLAVRIAYDEALAHKVIAGSDIVLMPSRYEPCGLTQLYSLNYGTIPLVRDCGGLRDTVQEFDASTQEGNGFVFSPYEAADFLSALDRALAVFRQKKHWHALMKTGMSQDFSWNKSARAYLELYQCLVK